MVCLQQFAIRRPSGRGIFTAGASGNCRSSIGGCLRRHSQYDQSQIGGIAMLNALATKTILGYFKTSWTSSIYATTPVDYSNVQSVTDYAQGKVPWVRITIVPAVGERITIGSSRVTYRFQGQVKVGIYVPVKIGSLLADQMADIISDILREKTLTYTQGNVIFRVPSISQGFKDDFGWWCVPLNVSYIRNAQSV